MSPHQYPSGSSLLIAASALIRPSAGMRGAIAGCDEDGVPLDPLHELASGDEHPADPARESAEWEGVAWPSGEPAHLVLPDSQQGRDVGDAVVVLKGDVAPVSVRSGHGRLTSSACLSRKRQGGGGWFPCSGCIASERWGSCARFVSAGIDRRPSRCRLTVVCPGASRVPGVADGWPGHVRPVAQANRPPGAMESLPGGGFPT